MTDDIIRVGNTLALTFRNKQHGTNCMANYLKDPCEYTIKVTVLSIKKAADGVAYIGYYPVGFSKGYSGGGGCKLKKSGEWGCIDHHKIDEYTTRPAYGNRCWNPKPGDRGYDLMC